VKEKLTGLLSSRLYRSGRVKDRGVDVLNRCLKEAAAFFQLR
jgi:hypothetical protein